MSLQTVQQLYTDVEKLAEKNPGHFGSQEAVTSFNDDLKDAKKEYPDNEDLAKISEIHEQIRNEGLLIVVGRLKAVLES